MTFDEGYDPKTGRQATVRIGVETVCDPDPNWSLGKPLEQDFSDDEQPLKTLEEFNAERKKLYSLGIPEPCRNGIACPDCGSELWDSNPSATLLSNPPQKDIHCSMCNYRGTRLA